MNQQILTQTEVDALLQGIGGDAAVGEPQDATTSAQGARRYDLASQDRLVRERMPTLELVHERFARNLRTGLFHLTRKTAEVSLGGLKVQKYSAFLRELVVPANFNIVGVKPLRGSALVVCEPNLVFAVVDALFGGAGKYATHIEGREFSATEQRVIQRLLQTVIAEYRKAWNGVYPLELEPQRSEMQPQFANIAAPGEMVVSASFLVEIGATTAAVNLCFPYATLEPIRDVLYSNNQGEAGEPDRRWLQLLKTEIQSAQVELVATLATAPATVEQLLSFKPGDFIELDLDPLIQAKVDGVPVFDCHYGTSNKHYAIKIDQLLTGSRLGWLGETTHVR